MNKNIICITNNSKVLFLFVLFSFMLSGITFSQEWNSRPKINNELEEQLAKENKKIKIALVKERIKSAGFYDYEGKLPENLTVIEKSIFNKTGTIKEQNLYSSNGKVNTANKYFYNSKSSLIKIQSSNQYGLLIFKRESKYDSKQREIERKIFEAIKSKELKVLFSYNKNNQVIQLITKNSLGNLLTAYKLTYQNGLFVNSVLSNNKGIVISTTLAKYDSLSRLILESIKENYSEFEIVYKYDMNGNNVEQVHPTHKRILMYDDSGNITEDKLFDNKGARQYKIIFLYNEKGLISDEIRYDGKDRPGFHAKYKYVYY